MNMDLTISQLCEESHDIALRKGWWHCPKCTGKGSLTMPNADGSKYTRPCIECGGSGRGNRSIPEQLVLMISELTEALEHYRNGCDIQEIEYSGSKPDGFVVELADCMIRIADTAERYKLPLEEALRKKLDYNRTRPYRHGNKAC